MFQYYLMVPACLYAYKQAVSDWGLSFLGPPAAAARRRHTIQTSGTACAHNRGGLVRLRDTASLTWTPMHTAAASTRSSH